MFKTHFARPALFALTLATIGAAAPALAAEPDNTVPTELRVDIDQSDFATATSIANLRSKVARAARAACKADGNTIDELAHSRACFAQAAAKANAQIDAMIQQQLAGPSQGQAVVVTAPVGPHTVR